MVLEDNVKVVRVKDNVWGEPFPDKVQLTEAAKARESIVTHAIENAREGARLLEEAIDWAEVLRPSHENKSLLVRVHQFVEEMEQTL